MNSPVRWQAGTGISPTPCPHRQPCGLPPAGRKAYTMPARRTAFLLRSVRRRRTACSAGKHDHFRRHAPAMVIIPIQTNTLFKAIETSWSWSPYFFTPYSVPSVGGKDICRPRCSHYVQLVVWPPGDSSGCFPEIARDSSLGTSGSVSIVRSGFPLPNFSSATGSSSPASLHALKISVMLTESSPFWLLGIDKFLPADIRIHVLPVIQETGVAPCLTVLRSASGSFQSDTAGNHRRQYQALPGGGSASVRPASPHPADCWYHTAPAFHRCR